MPGGIGSGGIVEIPFPPNGALGFVLGKTGVSDYQFDWVAPGGGGGGIASLSAGTTQGIGPQIVFSNSNGVSFGMNGNTMTASVAAAGGLTNINVSAGTTSQNLSALTFSNSNGLAFGLNGSVITGSYTVPVVPPETPFGVSAGTQSVSTGTLVFADSNGITFGMSGSSRITASHNGLTSQSNQALSGSNGSFTFQTASFGNSNGFSFLTSNGSMIGSYTVPVVPPETPFGISAGTQSVSTGTLVFSNSNGMTFGMSGSSRITGSYSVPVVSNAIQVVGSATGSGTNTSRFAADDHVHEGVFSAGVTNAGNTVGDTRVGPGRIVFQGGPNITLSQITAANALNTIVISGGAGGGGNTGSISAGTTRGTLGEVVFSNSNGISFGMNGQTVTASYTVPTQSVQPGIQSISGGTTRATTGEVVFSNSNGISFGVNGQTMTASHNGLTSQSNQNVTAQNGGFAFQTLSFSNANGISFGTSAGSAITASLVPETPFGISAGTQSVSTGTMIFSNSNGITFGMSGSSRITASYTVPGTLSVFAQSNTTQSSSGTIPFNSLQFQGAGIASVGVSNGSVVISVPAGGGGITNINVSAGTTSQNLSNIVFSNSNGVSFGLNGSTITGSVAAGGGGAVSRRWLQLPAIRHTVANLTQLTAMNGIPFFIPFFVDGTLTVSRLEWEMSRSTSGSNHFTLSAGVYTYVNDTQVSLLTSFSGSFSNTATASISGVRKFGLLPSASFSLAPGEYVLALHFTATATASINYSIRGFTNVAQQTAAVYAGADSYLTATSAVQFPFFGRNSVQTTGFLGSIAASQVRGQFTGSNSPIGAWVAFNKS